MEQQPRVSLFWNNLDSSAFRHLCRQNSSLRRNYEGCDDIGSCFWSPLPPVIDGRRHFDVNPSCLLHVWGDGTGHVSRRPRNVRRMYFPRYRNNFYWVGCPEWSNSSRNLYGNHDEICKTSQSSSFFSYYLYERQAKHSSELNETKLNSPLVS